MDEKGSAVYFDYIALTQVDSKEKSFILVTSE